MALRFPCIATSRRRRAIAASMSSPSARVRRASASLRRASGLWRSMAIDGDPSAFGQGGRFAARTPAAPPPTIVSRR
jgi:hypothetical protein